jgi:2-polyprenyl-3-methyl-5-hydroxy-6-metoxy-1,4-benzoquinol methylase
MDPTELASNLDRYSWYHRMRIAGELYTHSPVAQYYQPMWDFNLRAMDVVDFKDKKVLDVACRDGLFSFEAERRGARQVVGIDNDLSRGATEFLIPYFESDVRMYETNILDMMPQKFGAFDIILCFGVLYHLLNRSRTPQTEPPILEWRPHVRSRPKRAAEDGYRVSVSRLLKQAYSTDFPNS